MQTILIVILLLLAITLIGVVLIQRSEGGALGIGGQGSFMTARGSANLLTRATAIIATLFIAVSLALAVTTGGSRKSRSVMEEAQPTAPPSPVVEETPAVPQVPEATGELLVIPDTGTETWAPDLPQEAPVVPEVPAVPMVPEAGTSPVPPEAPLVLDKKATTSSPSVPMAE